MSTTSNNVTLWSKTPGSNTTADAGINWAEGMLPPAVNDSARGMMAAIANWRDDLGAITTTGTANSYSLTTNTGFAALATGLIVIAKFNASNTGASTLNVDGLGSKAIRKFTTGGEAAMGSGELQTGGAYLLRYDTSLNSAAGAWLCLNPPSASGTTSLGGTGRLYGSNATSSNLTDILVGTGLTITGSTLSCTVSGGAGTVTSVSAGNGLTGGPITGSGSLSVQASSGISVSGSGVAVTIPVFAYGNVSSGGSLNAGSNVSVSRSATGTYAVTFSSSASSSNYAVGATSTVSLVCNVAGQSTSGFTLTTRANGGSNTDAQFSFIVVGG